MSVDNVRQLRNGQPQLRITAWPGMPVPTPAVAVFARYTVDPRYQVILPEPSDPVAILTRTPTHTHPSGEIYLRLLDVDLDDLDAIFRFVNAYGILGVYEIENQWRWPHFSIPVSARERALLEAARRAAGIPVAQREKAWFDRSGETPPDDSIWLDPERAGFEDEEIETLVEFRYGAQQIRDAVTAIRFLRGELSGKD